MESLEPEDRPEERELVRGYDRILQTKGEAESLGRQQKEVVRSARSAFRAASQLDFQGMRKHAKAAQVLLATYAEEFGRWEGAVSAFRLSEVSEQEYRDAFELSCLKAGLRLEGSFPSYELFPFDIRFSLSQEQVTINRQVHRTMDPDVLAAVIRKEQDRLNRSRFNAGQFMSALLRAYDLLIAESIQARGKPMKQVGIKKVYQVLTLLGGRAAYSEKQFAFDIYRLRETSDLLYDGRHLVFGHVRSQANAIAVPSPRGTDYLGYLEVRREESEA